MKPAILHVGMPKAGSSSIQVTAAAHRAALANAGVIYPGSHNAHHDLLAQFHPSRDRYWFFVRQGTMGAKAQSAATALLDEIRSVGSDKEILISSEHLFAIRADGLRRLDSLLAETGHQMRVLCYVRHPVSHAASAVQQSIKVGNGRRLSDIETILKERHMAQPFLEIALDLFGPDRVCVRRFEDALRDGLETDPYRVMGRPDVAKLVKPVRINEGICATGVFLLDAFNGRPDMKSLRARHTSAIRAMTGDKFGLPPELAEMAWNVAAPELDWLERQFGIRYEQTNEGVDHDYYKRAEMAAQVEKSLTARRSLLHRVRQKLVG